jgi:hypothetical protein
MLAKFSMPKFSEWQLFGKQPFVRFGSTRPLPDLRAHYPISIIQVPCDSAECPVFGKQIDIIATLVKLSLNYLAMIFGLLQRKAYCS